MFGLLPALVFDVKSPGYIFNLFSQDMQSFAHKSAAMARMNDQIKPIIKFKPDISKLNMHEGMA